MIQKGQILVATHTQYRKCGRTLLYMDQIVKAANYEDTVNKTVIVFRSKRREDDNDWERVKTDEGKLRPATEKEMALYEAGVKNCRGELV